MTKQTAITRLTTSLFKYILVLSLSIFSITTSYAQTSALPAEPSQNSSMKDQNLSHRETQESKSDVVPPKPKNYQFYFGGEFGLGFVSDDFTLNIRPFIGGEVNVPQIICSHSLCQTVLSSDLNFPLRIVLYDAPPVDKNQFIRKADWDSVSDYFRVLNQISYGRPDEPFYLRFGTLNAVTLGNGTIVQNYSNTLNPDRYELGLQYELHTPIAGGTLLVDDLLDPDLVAVHAYIRPFQISPTGLFLDRVAFGFSLAAHIEAPRQLKLLNQSFVRDEKYNYVASSRDTALVYGFNLDVTSIENSTFLLKHYLDFNFLSKYPGLHVGSEARWNVTPNLTLHLKGELRASARGYIPVYVSPLFETDQYAYLGWDSTSAVPIRKAASQIKASGMGGLLGGAFTYSDWLTFGMIYEGHHRAKNDRLTLHMHIKPYSWISAGLFYYNQNGNFPLDILNPINAYVSTELRANFYGPFYAYGAYVHRFTYEYPSEKVHYNDWEAGAGVNFKL